VAIVAVGGMANLRGAVVMGTVLTFLSLRGYFGSLDDLVFGDILLAMMLFAPEGIAGPALWRRLGAARAVRAKGGHGTAP
jgi:branched-chain amino acid transport system permease protein